MKIVTDSDVQTFTDPEGDRLVLLTTVRQRDVEKAADIAQQEAMEALKGLGMSLEEAMKQAREADAEQVAAARERVRKEDLSPGMRRFRLQAVAQRLTVGAQEYGGHAIVEAYENMDPASARWVDEQVDTVWKRALPDDASRESSPAGLDGPDQPERNA
jgi:hypothetical protein